MGECKERQPGHVVVGGERCNHQAHLGVTSEGKKSGEAYPVVHDLKRRLAAGCVPVFSTDGLKHYYYALTAHFGKWEWAGGKKQVWVLLCDLVYGQVIKHHRRRRMVEVEQRVFWWEKRTSTTSGSATRLG